LSWFKIVKLIAKFTEVQTQTANLTVSLVLQYKWTLTYN